MPGLALAELPGGARGGVRYLDAEGVEFGADLVGARPVLLLAGLGALGDQPLDRGVLLRGEVGRGSALIHLGQVEVGEAEAEQRVGGGHDHAETLGAYVWVAERFLQG